MTPSVTMYYEVVAVCWIVFVAAWAILATIFGGGGRRYQSPRALGVRILLAIAIVLGVRYGTLASFEPSGDLASGAAAAGAALCVVGLAFAVWARVALGRNWGMPMTLHENPELVTSGPYRYVRHPIYTGLTAMLIGTSLVYPLAAIPCALMIAYTVFSALREERDMEARFPEAYPEYKKRSKMLVPFLI
jgi:protein-S-isoprenylcysteine O-methyltransferase Ste14